MLGLRRKDPASTIAVHVSTKKELTKLNKKLVDPASSFEGTIQFLIDFYKLHKE